MRTSSVTKKGQVAIPALVQNDVRAAFRFVSPRRSASLEQMRVAVRERAGNELTTFDRRLRRTTGVSPV